MCKVLRKEDHISACVLIAGGKDGEDYRFAGCVGLQVPANAVGKAVFCRWLLVAVV